MIMAFVTHIKSVGRVIGWPVCRWQSVGRGVAIRYADDMGLYRGRYVGLFVDVYLCLYICYIIYVYIYIINYTSRPLFLLITVNRTPYRNPLANNLTTANTANRHT